MNDPSWGTGFFAGINPGPALCNPTNLLVVLMGEDILSGRICEYPRFWSMVSRESDRSHRLHAWAVFIIVNAQAHREEFYLGG